MRRLQLASLIMAGLALALAGNSQARVARYVENSSNNPDDIALGFPVPRARNQAEPFAGFRTAAGLSARFAELALHPNGPRHSIAGRSRNGLAIEMLCFGPDQPMQVLQTGGIHAREWAAPEAVTAIAEALTLEREQPLFAWVADTLPLCLIPALNPDGFGATQDQPDLTRVCEAPEDGNVQGNCPADTATPRDGRLRRKNLRDSDGQVTTAGDALLGVDLNRNVGPFWASGPGSSDQPDRIIYRGPSRASEPEARLLEDFVNAAAPNQMRLYIDTHSFSGLYFWNCTGRRNLDLTARNWVERMRRAARDAYASVPTGNPTTGQGCGEVGIGATDELFGYTLDIPAYTLELEPFCGASGNNCGAAQYGGFGVSHDGFILPERIVPLMRQDAVRMSVLAYSMAAGPAWLRRVRLLDPNQSRTLYQGEWQSAGGARELQVSREGNLVPGATVELELRFDRPMRWLDDSGTVALYPGQAQTLNPQLQLVGASQRWTVASDTGEWVTPEGGYATEAFLLRFSLPTDWNGDDELGLEVSVGDNATFAIDADPATPTRWSQGEFQNADGGVDSRHVLHNSARTTPTNPPASEGQGGSGAGSWLLLILFVLRRATRQRG